MELFGSFTIVQDIEALMMCPTFDDFVWCKDKGSFHYVTDCYFENLNTMERMSSAAAPGRSGDAAGPFRARS